MTSKKIAYDGQSAAEVPALLEAAGIPWNKIESDTWKRSDDNPAVRFRIAHAGDRILLHFHVEEHEVLAVAAEDNGKVWEDSCCEFFLSPDRNQVYYNFECSCIGKLLLHGGHVDTDRSNAPEAAYKAVRRWSSLGSEPFESRKGDFKWDLVEIIPAEALFLHAIDRFDGRKMTANFYKCGNHLEKYHFLSWAPIDLPAPNFHCPKFFATVEFE